MKERKKKKGEKEGIRRSKKRRRRKKKFTKKNTKETGRKKEKKKKYCKPAFVPRPRTGICARTIDRPSAGHLKPDHKFFSLTTEHKFKLDI